MKRKVLTLVLATVMTATAFGTSYVANSAEATPVAQSEDQAQGFNLTGTYIDGELTGENLERTVYTDDPITFTSTTEGGNGNITYKYFISDGRMDAQRVEIPAQGYKITEPGTYRINVGAIDADGNTTGTDYFVNVKWKVLGTTINNSYDRTVHTYTPLYFASTNSSACGNVTYHYFISDGRMDAQRVEIPQGYKITKPGTYRINVGGQDAKGNFGGTDFFINVVD